MEVTKLNGQELVEKERENEQWKQYNKTVEKNNSVKKPSERQIAYIVSLAKTVGLRIDIGRIDNIAKASSIIERMKMLSRIRQLNGFNNGNEIRDKRIAFGMATKFIFKKYLDWHKDYRKLKGFWKEVEEFYRQYQERQEMATKLSAD